MLKYEYVALFTLKNVFIVVTVFQLRRKKLSGRKQGNESESFKRKKFFKCNFCLAIAYAKIA